MFMKKNPPTRSEGTRSSGSRWLGFSDWNACGFLKVWILGYTDFKRASRDNRTIGFQKDKKKLTDIGFLGLVFLRIGSEFNGIWFSSDIGLIDN